MSGDARQEALQTISRLRRTHDLTAEDLAGDEFRLLAEGHGRPARGDSPGDRFVGSASFAAWRDGMTQAVAVPVLEAAEVAATVDYPDTQAPSDSNAIAELASDGVFTLVSLVPVESGLEALPRGLDGTEPATSIAVAAGNPSLEVELTARGDPKPMRRHAFHVNAVPRTSSMAAEHGK